MTTKITIKKETLHALAELYYRYEDGMFEPICYQEEDEEMFRNALAEIAGIAEEDLDIVSQKVDENNQKLIGDIRALLDELDV